MIAYQINVRDRATPFLVKSTVALRKPAALNQIVGRACQQMTKQHFLDLNQQRHRSPNKVVGFYATVASSVSFTSSQTSAIIAASHVAIAQRFYGGTIRPVKVNWLTIPARSETLDKSAREFNDLVVLFRGGVPFALASASSEGSEIMFWLRKQVNQKPDPTVLPSVQKYADTAAEAIKDYLDVLEMREAA